MLNHGIVRKSVSVEVDKEEGMSFGAGLKTSDFCQAAKGGGGVMLLKVKVDLWLVMQQWDNVLRFSSGFNTVMAMTSCSGTSI